MSVVFIASNAAYSTTANHRPQTTAKCKLLHKPCIQIGSGLLPEAVPDHQNCRGPAGGLPGACRGPAGGLPGTCRGPAVGLLGACQGPAGALLYQNGLGLQQFSSTKDNQH
jgi:hypothetical protein